MIKNSDLVGKWKSKTSNDMIFFKKVDGEHYRLTINDEIIEAFFQ